ncbi:MAG: tetratricopeptide repeat protein, partial [Bradymonadaceae bacterium]
AQPDRSLNQYLLCEAHLSANDGSEAAMACRKAKRQNPDYLPGLLTVTRLYLHRGDLTKASSVLDRLESRFGDHWGIAKLRVRTLIHRHRISEARARLDEWRQRPVAEEDEFHLFDGLVALARADYDRALGHFEKAESDSRYRQEARLHRAQTLTRLGKLEEAVSVIRDGLTDHPRWRPAAWLIFGEIRRRQGRLADATENFDLAEKYWDPGLTPPWRVSQLYKERAFTIRDQYGWADERVIQYLGEGKRLGDTESPEIQLGMGLYYLHGPQVDLERAATHLRKVIDLQPHRCRAIRGLAETYRQLGRRSGVDEMEKLDRKNCGG